MDTLAPPTTTSVDLEDGLEVIVHGDVDYWVEGGKLDIKPWRITVVGEGEQAAALERLTSELEQADGSMTSTRKTHRDFLSESASSPLSKAMPDTTFRTRSTVETPQLTS